MIPTLNIPKSFFTSNYQPCIVQGDTIPKITFAFDVGDAIDLTGSTIKMQVYDSVIPFIDISNGNGITIVDGKTFEIDEVSAANNTYPVGTFTGDLEITLADGTRKTYFKVNYTITQQYTV